MASMKLPPAHIKAKCKIYGFNPVHYHESDGTWWWYSDQWTLERGPYKTEKEAKIDYIVHKYRPHVCPDCKGIEFALDVNEDIVCNLCGWKIDLDIARITQWHKVRTNKKFGGPNPFKEEDDG